MILMKKYSNLFYTRAFKCILLAFITAITWCTSGYITDMFILQVTNRSAVKNVFTQPFSFDYDTSEYKQQEIENTIDCVMDYSLNYSRAFSPDEGSSYEKFDYYMSLGSSKYKSTVEYLKSLKGVNFAVVNHSTDRIVSNISEIQGSSAGTEIRHLFASETHPFIIIRNCSNPYYEQGSLPGYVDHVREKASEYTDNCDLYLSFSEGLLFREDAGYYENMHREISGKVFSLAKKILILSFASFICILTLIKVSGRAEKNGKIIASLTDQLPTDMIIVFEISVIASAVALYNTSLYMIYKTSTIEDYGIGFRPQTYAFRADVTLVIIVYFLCALLCKIKRQKSLGTLYSGSYICFLRNILRKRKEGEDAAAQDANKS